MASSQRRKIRKSCCSGQWEGVVVAPLDCHPVLIKKPLLLLVFFIYKILVFSFSLFPLSLFSLPQLNCLIHIHFSSINIPITMSIPPSFPDISKDVNGLLNRDFYHLNKAALDLKTKAPNGVAFALKGKTDKNGGIAANIETKYADKASGLTLTQGWNTANALDTKVELADLLSPGLKLEFLTSVIPNGAKGAKLNLYFSQPKVNVRAFFDLLKGPTFAGDFTVGHEGYVAGSEVGYDISAGKITRLAGSVGFIHPVYSVAATTSNNFSLFTASYFHKVSPFVEAGAKATYDTNSPNGSKPVNIEFATRYLLDPTSFVKAKLADSGLAAIAYSQQLRPGVTLGLGASFDALRLAEPVHKVGLSLSFAA